MDCPSFIYPNTPPLYFPFSSPRLNTVLAFQTLLLLLASNQGLLQHVTEKQSGVAGSLTQDALAMAQNANQQYASFEELQKMTENPFDNNTSVNATVPLGDTAFLRCKVRNLGERSISWYRRRDWHILTTGKITYTNDERFQVLHADGSDDWTLLIKFVQKRDNGTYECQVSTGTGIVSYLVHLTVAIPEAFILGNGEYHVEQGSNINLVCIIEKSPKPPEYIFWYHNERMINYGNTREVTVLTEPGSKTQSRLTIRDARISDSGNYTCKTAHADPASIYVYVSQASGLFSGDKIAAIQRRNEAAGGASSSTTSIPPFYLTTLLKYLLSNVSPMTFLITFHVTFSLDIPPLDLLTMLSGFVFIR